MVELATLIERNASPNPSLLEQTVFNSRSAEVVASAIESFVSGHVGEIRGALFYYTSVGVVAGFELMSGDEVVTKVHYWNASIERLRDVQRLQAHLLADGLPAPRPLVGPTPLGNGVAVIEELRRGAAADGHQPQVRKALATELCAFISSSSALIGQVELGGPLVLLDCGDELWPEPHDQRFDFDRTSSGAEWIDDIARGARLRLLDSRGGANIGHFDWRVQNLGFDGDVITAIYDWDSVGSAPEPVIVGCAAAQFTAAWNETTMNPLPNVEEMQSFVDFYEIARGSAFTRREHELLDAANLWSCAYGARCQHSDKVASGEDPTKTDYGQLLRQRSGSELL